MTQLRILVLLILVIAIGAVPASASMIFNFDESGDIEYSLNSGAWVPMTPGVLEADPTGGVTGRNVLVYNLTSGLDTYTMYNGDVPVDVSSGSLIADLRFTDQNGPVTGTETCGGTVECLMIFYVFDNNGLPADVGPISTSFLTTENPATTLESDTFTYTAGVITYEGTIVPEPAPAAMLFCGAALLALLSIARARRRSHPLRAW
jgi:hypothetical protein